MKEHDHIEDAFGSKIKSIFASFFQSYTDAQGDAAKEKKAEDVFRNGITHARRIRERALALLS